MQCKCRNELKMLTHEMTGARPVDSSTRLMDFAKTHPEIFDLLWCQYAYTMSATRIIEAAHGFQRDSYDGQRSFARNNAQLRYIVSTVYTQRQARRRAIYKAEKRDEDEDKKERKSTVKHADRKYTCRMAGIQTEQLKARYTDSAIVERIPDDIRKKNSITMKIEKGLFFEDKKHEDQLMDHARAKQQKNLTRRTTKTLEEHSQEAIKWQPKHDATWNTREEQERIDTILRMLTKSLWQGIPASMLEDKVRNVLPAFWKTYKKTIPDNKFTKGHLLRPAKSGDTWQTNLGKFLLLVGQISDGKAPTTISTKRRAEVLEKDAKNATFLLNSLRLTSQSGWRYLRKEKRMNWIKSAQFLRATASRYPPSKDGRSSGRRWPPW